MSEVILFQGDSITEAQRDRGDPLNLGSGYPYQVASRLGYERPGEYTFYNRAISGNRSVDVYARIKQDIINLQPDYLSILMGVNDVWHEFISKNGVPVEKYEMIYNLMLEEIRDSLPNVKIFLLEPYALPDFSSPCIPPNELDDWKLLQRLVGEYARATTRVAQKNGIPFVPLQKKFEEFNGKHPGILLNYDGVHPTIYGHRLICDEWLKQFYLLK